MTTPPHCASQEKNGLMSDAPAPTRREKSSVAARFSPRAGGEFADAAPMSCENYRFLCDALPIMAWVARPDGATEHANRALLAYFGAAFEPGQVGGWQSCLHPNDFAECARQWLGAIATGAAHEQIVRLRPTPQDAYRRHRLRVQAIQNAQGVLVKWVGTCEDIEGARSAEDAEAAARADARLHASEERFRMLTQGVRDYAICLLDVEGRVLSWNAGAERIKGYRADEIIGQPISVFYTSEEAVHPDSGPEAMLAEAAREGRCKREGVRVRKDGTLFWANVVVTALHDAEGQLNGFAKVTRDITTRRRVEKELLDSQRFIQRVADASPNILYIYDLAARANVYANREVGVALGYTLEEIIAMGDQLVARLLHPEDAAEVAAHWQRFETAQEGEVFEVEYRMRHADGGWRWLYSRDTLFARTPEGKPLQILGTAQDVTERRAAEQRLEESLLLVSQANVQLDLQRMELAEANARLEALATTDGLTGLKNHRAFQECMEIEFQRAARYGTPLSVILLDVDCFKQYNDRFGHPAGDQVLKQVAQILQTEARSSDTAARYGGEEFVVVLPETDIRSATAVAERLRAAVENAPWLERRVTVSLGVATCEPTTENGAALVTQADAGLYHSKKQGRNCVTHYQALAPWLEASAKAEAVGRAERAAESASSLAANLMQAYDKTIEGWSRLLDLRDKETEGHAERVTHMTVRLAAGMGLSEDDLVYVRWGALLHDIGKMGVPDNILLKPGALDDQEWEIMRRHPGYAYEMLSPIQFLRPALDIPYCHHEKWDGTGYPRRMAGEAIPLAARLFAVVDVWDALRSDRPYRKGWPEAKVREHIQAQSGTHFDPRAVEAFLKLLNGDVLITETRAALAA